MKKALSLILALVLCLSLCACVSNTDALSSEEKAIVGEWISQSKMDLVLTDSGRGLQLNSDNSGSTITWEVYDGMVYIYRETGAVSASSQRFIISGDNLLDSNGNIIYTKK